MLLNSPAACCLLPTACCLPPASGRSRADSAIRSDQSSETLKIVAVLALALMRNSEGASLRMRLQELVARADGAVWSFKTYWEEVPTCYLLPLHLLPTCT